MGRASQRDRHRGPLGQARRLPHDSTLKPEDRVAGLLVLLYAQWPATISQLTLSHVQTTGGQARTRPGHEPAVRPEPPDAPAQQLAATRPGHAAIGDQGTAPWLFPGGQPGRPISAGQLTERHRQLGIHAGQARSAALFQLATDLPAAIPARTPGIHISVAVAWQPAPAGDWATHAADISRRSQPAPTEQRTDHPPTSEAFRQLRYLSPPEKIANRVAADEYAAVSTKIDALDGQPPELPAGYETTGMARLRREACARMLGNGLCTRPAELDCRLESACETCAYFRTGTQFLPILTRQRDHAQDHGQADRAALFEGLIQRAATERS